MKDFKKKALLIVDRGSREDEVKAELARICKILQQSDRYHFVNYCFLEVIPPYIEDGVNNCIANGAEQITIMPYFLYPGMKLKNAVKKCAALYNIVSVQIAKPLSYSLTMSEIITERIRQTKIDKNIILHDTNCDIVIIGHGSSDKNAHDAFFYTINSIKSRYRNVYPCFLELDRPRIDEAIEKALEGKPTNLIIMPYFLHRGTHIKKDIGPEIEKALTKYRKVPVYLTDHIGVDKNVADLILERALEVEKRNCI